MTRITVLLVLAIVTTTTADDLASDRAMLAQTAQENVAAPPKPPTAARDNLDDAERTARTEANLALARLELILARKDLKSGEHVSAARRAHQVLALLDQIPPEVDVQEMSLQAEGILSRSQRAGVDTSKLRRDARATAPLQPGDADRDRQTQAAVRVSRQYTGPPRDDVDAPADARALRARALREQVSESVRYRPGRALVDIDAILATNAQRLHYEGVLREAYKSDEMRILVQSDESRLLPDDVVGYPPDWPERTQRRARYADGVIARTPSWTDQDGQEWYIAVYDIHDLIYVPPDFGLEAQFSANQFAARNAADRAALRGDLFDGLVWGSVRPEDAIPLLRYFGGVNAWIDRGPKYSLERQREIVNLIQTFVGGRVETTSDTPPLPPAP